jgi:hypothetical protein
VISIKALMQHVFVVRQSASLALFEDCQRASSFILLAAVFCRICSASCGRGQFNAVLRFRKLVQEKALRFAIVDVAVRIRFVFSGTGSGTSSRSANGRIAARLDRNRWRDR